MKNGMKEVPQTEPATETMTLTIGKEKLEQEIADPFWLGNTIAFSYTNHNPKYVIGPHWPLFLCSFLFILAFSSVFLVFVLPNGKHSLVLVPVGVLLAIMDLGSFAATAVLNPGIPDRDMGRYSAEYVESLVKSKSLSYCSTCKTTREPNTYHCPDCNVCVEGYDHHCPWTGKCIGKGNARYFYTFLVSMFVLLFYMMGAALMSMPQSRL